MTHNSDPNTEIIFCYLGILYIPPTIFEILDHIQSA